MNTLKYGSAGFANKHVTKHVKQKKLNNVQKIYLTNSRFVIRMDRLYFCLGKIRKKKE